MTKKKQDEWPKGYHPEYKMTIFPTNPVTSGSKVGANNMTNKKSMVGLRKEIYKICFGLRANSIGTKDLKFDQMKEINEHLFFYIEKLLSLFQTYSKQARAQGYEEAVEEVKEETIKRFGEWGDIVVKEDLLPLLAKLNGIPRAEKE